MKIVFFGTSKFAIPSLEALIKSKNKPLLVVTRSDKPKGRSGRPSSPPLKEAALQHGIEVVQPEMLDQELCDKLKKLGPDLFVVIAYGHILSKDLLSIPKICSLNVHASILPKYRGASPINRAIIDGCTKTGVSIIRMNEHMDEGDVVSLSETDIKPDDDVISLGVRLSHGGASLLLQTIKDIENGKANFTKQNSVCASYAKKLSKEEGLIDWKEESLKIHNKVRGLLPWPSAYTYYDSKILKILKTQVLNDMSAKPGEVLQAEGGCFVVGAGKGALKILELQLEGGKRMDAASFLRGHRVNAGNILK